LWGFCVMGSYIIKNFVPDVEKIFFFCVVRFWGGGGGGGVVAARQDPSWVRR